jgi:hypothetical protein
MELGVNPMTVLSIKGAKPVEIDGVLFEATLLSENGKRWRLHFQSQTRAFELKVEGQIYVSEARGLMALIMSKLQDASQ